MKKVTVCTIFWKRIKHYNRVLQSWLNQDEVDEILIWDNSGSFKTDLPGVIVVSSSKNLNSRWRTLLAHIAKNDLIILAGDDFIAKKGLVADLLKHWDENKIIGIMGREFSDSEKYYHNSSAGRLPAVDGLVKVDYVCTNIILAHRKHHIDIDLRSIPSVYIDDWWWERKMQKKGVTLWVKRSGKWEMLPEARDTAAHSLDPRLQVLRELYFRKWVKKENINPWELYKKYLKDTKQGMVLGDRNI